MKSTLLTLAPGGLFILLFTACTKDVKESPSGEISASELAQVERLGFGTTGIQKIAEGYLVEGDIVLTAADLKASPTSPNMVIAQEEQYHTFNLVKNHPTIRIALSNSSSDHEAAFSAALNEAISRYNAENLSIEFLRVSTSQSPDITVVAYYEASNVLGSAGFPNKSGDPYNQVKMNTYHYNTSTGTTNVNYIATIMAHEMGHCIGFRHTDYMRRSYSCGWGGNEGQAKNGIGAVHIPGTPTGPDARSWMLACIGSGVNRPFNSNDKVALGYLY
ncbi:MAG TPA: M57 family metalloprotease [Chitinophagaceae bacterium]